jgi:glycosyltransferase involved in cell wall biosynthesis
MKPRILFLIRSLGRGGAERQLVALAACLRQSGWDVSVACFYGGGAFQPDLERADVPVIDLRKRGRWDLLGFTWRLWRTFRRTRPDIVHGYLTVGNLLSLLARLARRRTRVVWGVRSSFIDRACCDWISRLTFRSTCVLARFADSIVINSEAGAAHHASLGYPLERIRVVANGIDTQRFQFDAAGRVRLRAEWNIADDTILVGLIGRLDRMKDHPTFLQAASILAANDPRWRFVCVGGGGESGYACTLESKAAELGLKDRLIWAGPQDDMRAVYSALDIDASTSCGEGFPNTVAEAMACGRPCVVTDVGDSARIVGACGLVVEAGNPPAFAAAIESMGEMLMRPGAADVMHKSVRMRIEDCFALESLLRNSEAAFLDVVNARRSA